VFFVVMRIIAIVSYVKIYILFPVSFTFASVSRGLFRAFMLYVPFVLFCLFYWTRVFWGACHLFICGRHRYRSYVTTCAKSGDPWCERPQATSYRVTSVCCGRWRVWASGKCGAVFSLCFCVLPKQNIYYPTD